MSCLEGLKWLLIAKGCENAEQDALIQQLKDGLPAEQGAKAEKQAQIYLNAVR